MFKGKRMSSDIVRFKNNLEQAHVTSGYRMQCYRPALMRGR